MASKQQQAISARDDNAAIIVDGRDALAQLAFLVRAIDRRNLWHEIAWDGEQAAAEAQRDLARVRRALEAARIGEY
jgi:hypothetical protein